MPNDDTQLASVLGLRIRARRSRAVALLLEVLVLLSLLGIDLSLHGVRAVFALGLRGRGRRRCAARGGSGGRRGRGRRRRSRGGRTTRRRRRTGRFATIAAGGEGHGRGGDQNLKTHTFLLCACCRSLVAKPMPRERVRMAYTRVRMSKPSFSVAVVMQRRAVQNRWIDAVWEPWGVVPS